MNTLLYLLVIAATMLLMSRNLPGFHVAYVIPPNRTPDHYALEMLITAIGDGASSRIYQDLVKRREIIQDISVYTEDMRGPDVLGVFGVMAQGHPATEGRDALLAIFEDVVAHGVTAAELQKARVRLRSTFVFLFESNLSRANQLAEFELVSGDATSIREELDRYLAVTNADIQRVAARYLVEPNRTELLVEAGAESGEQP